MYDFFNKTCPLEDSPLLDQDNFWTDGHVWDAHRIGWTVSGVFAAVDTIFAFTLIWLHLRNYRRPEFQRYYVRIILMIPVYSVVSWLGYRFFRASTYYEFGLEAYEAFVICSFMILMCNFLGSEMHSKIAAHERQGLIFPFCCIKVRPSSMYFLESIKWSVLQFAIVAPAVSITAIILQTQGLLCPGSMSLAYGNSWLEIIKTVSVTVATYFLIEFYYVIHKDIAQYKPLWKFICIKLVIFLTFYQTFVFQILAHFNVIKGTEYWTAANVEYGLGALCITVEMFIFCWLHLYAYSHREFADPKYKSHTSVLKAAVDAFNIFDLFIEVYRNMKWIVLVVILRRPYVRTPQDAKFDIYDAMNGKRDLAIYGNHETYTMLDVPAGQTQPRDFDDEEAFDKSPYVGPKDGQPRKSEVEYMPPTQYSNTYGKDRV